MGLFSKLFGSKQPAPPCANHADDGALRRPDDIEWWNSLSLDDCQALEKEDNVFFAAFVSFIETDRLSDAEAGKKVRLSFPDFYWKLEDRADEKFTLAPEDAKLRYVLKHRINCAVIARLIDKQALERASSFKALVRQLIRSG